MEHKDIFRYAILGCGLSNLSSNAYPFSVVILAVTGGQSALLGAVLNGWQNRREEFPDAVRESILFLIDDFQSSITGDEALRFFERLCSLSMGPIRSLTQEECDSAHLDERISAFFDGGLYPITWPESFTRL